MGHLHCFSARVGGNLNKNSQKKSNARGVLGGGGMLKLRFDRYLIDKYKEQGSEAC